MQKEIVFNRPVDGALYLFERGYKVFPVVQDGKTPAVKSWQEWAVNATEKKIREYGTANPLSNWGVSCGPSNLTVIDIDNKKGRNGDATFKEICQGQGGLDTLEILTPTGGRHLYFTGDGPNTVGRLGEGIDTRGDGGYVVAPGSRVGDEVYRVIKTNSAVGLPTFLYEKLEERKEARVITEDAPIIEGERNNAFASLAGHMRSRGFGFEAIRDALLAENKNIERPLPAYEIENIAASIARYAPDIALTATAFAEIKPKVSRRGVDIHPLDIRRRDWIMADRYLGGYVSVIVAPGGVGKSMLTMLDAIAVCTGKPITGYDVIRKGAVWIYNTEDPMEELDRRIVAASIHHRIPLSEMADLHLSSGRDQPMVLVKADNHGIHVNHEEVKAIARHIKENNIALFIIDPFVHSHECNENDNMQIAKVAQCLQHIAETTGCAVAVVHHANKAGAKAEEGDVNISRGASALANAARIAHTIQGMKPEEAKKFGIPPEKRGWYMRIDNAKANLQPPAERAEWFQKVSISLINGDHVGSLERATLTDYEALRKTDETAGERADLARVLAGVMAVGDVMTLVDMIDVVFHKPKYSHLFKLNDAHPRTHRRRAMTLFEDGPVVFGELRFTLIETEGKKYIVRCGLVSDPEVGSCAAQLEGEVFE